MIRLHEISKSFSSKVVCKEISYHFPQGERIALVGANGAGKSTLLRIICGEEDADGGQVIKPNRCSIGYLPQMPNPHPKPSLVEECLEGAKKVKAAKLLMDQALTAMQDHYTPERQNEFERCEAAFRDLGGLVIESKAKGILHGLGFAHVGLSGLDTHPLDLSGGWRMRLELAKIFLDEPDFLVLDEPTNHLDLTSLTFVESYLRSFPGTLLFVSHDKSLLNRLSTVTCHLANGSLIPYKGNFDEFLEQKELQETQNAENLKQISKKINSLETFVSRFGAKATKATQAQSRAKTIEKLRALETTLSASQVAPTGDIRLSIPQAPPSGRQVLELRGLSVGYPQRSLLSALPLTLKVERGQKIAVIGPNGVGKSTLLKTLMGLTPPRQGTVEWGYGTLPAYFSQDQLDSLDESKTILENILRAHPSLTEKEARSLAGALLFSGDDVFKKIGVLSGGEKSRVGLAKLLAQKANVLLLDEPTNHLDMVSVEILTASLADYPGTLIFVSHDIGFINSVCTHTLALSPSAGGALFEGNLEDYERWCRNSQFPNVLLPAEDKTPEPTKKAATPPTKVRSAPSVSRLQKELRAIEDDISATEIRIKALEEEMAHTTDFPSMGALQTQHATLVAHLNTLETSWYAVSETLEAAQLGRPSPGSQR